MEISAAYQAVVALPGRLEVVSDSTYVVNCFRDRWWEGWIKKGWVNSQRKPVANRDLWEPFVELVAERGDVTFRWVKGHAGDPMNDLVDRLAVEAAASQHGRSGHGVPDELGPGGLDRFRRRRSPTIRSSTVTAWWCSVTSPPSWGATTTTRGPTRCGPGWRRSSRPRR